MGLHPNSRGISQSETQGGTRDRGNVLNHSGIEPAPERSKRPTWSTFLKAHWKVLAASDFFSVAVWTPRGGFGEQARAMEIQVGVQILPIEGVDKRREALRDMAVAEVFAHEGAVL